MSEPEQLLPWPAVQPMVGNISRITWWRAIRDYGAPPPIHITPRRVVWRRSDIERYVEQRAMLLKEG